MVACGGGRATPPSAAPAVCIDAGPSACAREAPWPRKPLPTEPVPIAAADAASGCGGCDGPAACDALRSSQNWSSEESSPMIAPRSIPGNGDVVGFAAASAARWRDSPACIACVSFIGTLSATELRTGGASTIWICRFWDPSDPIGQSSRAWSTLVLRSGWFRRRSDDGRHARDARHLAQTTGTVAVEFCDQRVHTIAQRVRWSARLLVTLFATDSALRQLHQSQRTRLQPIGPGNGGLARSR